jgi:hypothetical protein
MNRAQRRLDRFGKRPSGQFLSELARRRLNGAYQEALRTEMQEEANGRPIHPEVAEQMTKEKKDQLFQVMVPDKTTGAMFHASPMMGKDACGTIAETINRQIVAGKRPNWGMAEVFPVQRIEGAD